MDPHRAATINAPEGMVCSVDHLASAAGVSLLRNGGNAADAAVAASAVLAVTSQHLCGMGGDLFALVHHDGGSPATLNASGRAGSGADPDRLRSEGADRMPYSGDIRSVPVPGCVDGWLALHERFGRLPLADVLEPARRYATRGFPASPLLAALIPLLAGVAHTDDFTRTPRVRSGDVIVRPGVAAALTAVVERGREGFYGGRFGEGLLALGDGEYLRSDLEQPLADWVDPLGLRVWDHDIWTVPPNSQGYLTLAGSSVVEHLGPTDDLDDDAWPHLLVESAKAVAHDRIRVLHEGADGADLLSAERLALARDNVDRQRISGLDAPAGSGDTIYLCAVDAERMAVSLIQSNAAGFGAGIFEPATRISLHNRGIGFSLEPGHPAEYGPGRRPPSTLCPALVTRPDGTLRGVVGTMGGDTQPQILLQVITRWLHHGQSPGKAIASPRWGLARRDGQGFDTWGDPGALVLRVEGDAPERWAGGLEARGHRVELIDPLNAAVGHAHLIEVREDGMLAGASDPRAVTGAAHGY